MKPLAKIVTLLASVATATTAIAAPITSWDAVAGFGSSEWSYMKRVSPGCVGPATLLPFNYTGPSGTNFIGKQGVNTPTIVPLVAKNLASSGVTVYSTAQIPAGALWLHPGETTASPGSFSGGSCAVVRFKAPMAGKFRVKGSVQSVDVGANTVRGYIFAGNNTAVGGPLTLTGPMGTSLDFDKIVTITGANKWIDFALDDGGSYYNDSTKLTLTISKCRGDGNGGSNDGTDDCHEPGPRPR
jgi:hypothetical protein